jgi:hypothetical protein
MIGIQLDRSPAHIGNPDHSISARLLLKIYEKTISSLKLEEVKKYHTESTFYNKK